MITIFYPQGCYGHYLAKCLYYYTDLRKHEYEVFKFDESGSSHDIRENKNLNAEIEYLHKDHLIEGHSFSLVKEKIITILPDKNHNLDYFNNQYSKQSNRDLLHYLNSMFPKKVIEEKLKHNWGWDREIVSSTGANHKSHTVAY